MPTYSSPDRPRDHDPPPGTGRRSRATARGGGRGGGRDTVPTVPVHRGPGRRRPARTQPSGKAHVAPGLPAAVEVVTAWTTAGNDPAFFWATVQRTLAEAASATEPDLRLAELVIGLSCLGGVLTQHLADATGTTPTDVLQSLAALYAAPDPTMSAHREAPDPDPDRHLG